MNFALELGRVIFWNQTIEQLEQTGFARTTGTTENDALPSWNGQLFYLQGWFVRTSIGDF